VNVASFSKENPDQTRSFRWKGVKPRNRDSKRVTGEATEWAQYIAKTSESEEGATKLRERGKI